MTLSETRKLGIEFERRVQTMIPEKEYLDKLDTETIYAYLNSYQDKYIHDIYRNLDNIKSGSKMSAHVESVLQEMLRTQTIDINDAKNYTGDITDVNGIVIVENGRSVTYPLDPSFYMYVRSVSNVISTYSFKSTEPESGKQRPIRVLPNELVSQSDVWRLLETPHNSLRILRYPAASIGAYEPFKHSSYKITSSAVEIKQTRKCDHPTSEYGLEDPGHTSPNGDVFRFNTYDAYAEQKSNYVLEYDGSNTSFRYCLVQYTPYGGEDDWTATNNIETGTLEDVKNAMFVNDPTQFPYLFVWLDNESAGNNQLILSKRLPNPINGEYTKQQILQMMPNVDIFDQLDNARPGYSTTFQYNGNSYNIQVLDDSIMNVPTLNVIYDQYTTPVGVKIIYYAQPQRFDLMTSTRCELPMDAFDDLVTGAVDLYIQYVAGAEANKRRIEQARQQAAKQQAQQEKQNSNDEE